ncbi:uncharacterized protein SPSK_06358 [Sporothrix schenckii 1099-18]|nr:uncharacterized protein SPSK_06358 [Sporothrix schenckii 1099-18]KJR89128.1 hypothetical protein SPSK_06358 [Sporothrix schenckii 1099-18]
MSESLGEGKSHEDGEADIWKGLSDKAERRKRQNRLHQRAWRRRKTLEASEAALAASNEGKASSGFWVLKPVVQTHSEQEQQLQLYKEGVQQPAAYFVLTPRPTVSSSPSGSSSPPSYLSGRVKLIPPLLQYVSNGSSATGSNSSMSSPVSLQPNPNLHMFILPAAFVHFPLSLDHRLLTLIQYNVLRATLTNMAILAILHSAMDADCGLDQILDHIHPPLPAPATSPDDLPVSLRPTPLQRRIFHDQEPRRPDMLWISSVPSPAMRDNLLRTYGQWDPDDLCCDLLGGLYEGFDDVERRGIIVWSDPWLPDSWEVTPGFAKKWPFLLTGCDELMAATDRWRAGRGEEPLAIDWGKE